MNFYSHDTYGERVAGVYDDWYSDYDPQAIDTLAAGDTWHGAFALALAERKELNEAITFATAVAACGSSKQWA